MHGHRDGESIGKIFLSSMKPLGKDLVTICYQKKRKTFLLVTPILLCRYPRAVVKP